MIVCSNIWIVALIMILTFIAGALWFRSISTISPDTEAITLSEAELCIFEHNSNDSSDDEQSLFEAKIYDVYVEFYAAMGEDELNNLDDYLEK